MYELESIISSNIYMFQEDILYVTVSCKKIFCNLLVNHRKKRDRCNRKFKR